MSAATQARRRSGMSLLGLLEVVCVMGLVATVTGYFARLWWLLELTTHFRPHFAVSLLGLAAFWAWRRRQRWAIACGFGCLANTLVILPHFFAGGTTPPSSGRSLTILSLNVHTLNPKPELVLDYLRATDADVVLLMEVDDAWMRRLGEWSASYPHRLEVPREDNFGIALFSRVSWTNASVVEFGSAGVPSLVADLALAGRQIHLVGTHPLPPGTASYAAQRNEQFEELARHVVGTTLPVVLVGDLNTTPWSPHFKDLLKASGLRDGSQGSGVSGTWPAFLPLGRIPIDHCLLSPEFALPVRQVGPPVDSDHLPMIWTVVY
jgi:MYXO-CTERM domain-containing protein